MPLKNIFLEGGQPPEAWTKGKSGCLNQWLTCGCSSQESKLQRWDHALGKGCDASSPTNTEDILFGVGGEEILRAFSSCSKSWSYCMPSTWKTAGHES